MAAYSYHEINYQFNSFASAFESLDCTRMRNIDDGNIVDRYDNVIDMNASIGECGTTLDHFRNVN